MGVAVTEVRITLAAVEEAAAQVPLELRLPLEVVEQGEPTAATQRYRVRRRETALLVVAAGAVMVQERV